MWPPASQLFRETAADQAREGHARLVAYRGDGSTLWEKAFPQTNGAPPVGNVGALTFWWPGHFRRADALLDEQMRGRSSGVDANDMLYQFESSREYDPSGSLDRITAPLLAINSADDLINPPELGLMETLMPRVTSGRYVLLPVSGETRGHGTHSWPAIWQAHLKAFLEGLRPRD